MKPKHIFIFIVLLFLIAGQAHPQDVLIDEVVAVVGNKIILESDLEAQAMQFKAQGATLAHSTLKCQALEDMLIQKLLINQAEIDSVQVTETQIESTLDQRIRYYISQFGSQDKLEAFYGKSVLEIKNEFRDVIRDQLMADEVQDKIIGKTAVTPSEVRAFYNNIPVDNIPLIPAEYEVRQIVKKPPVGIEEINAIRGRLKSYRDRIVAGERFATFAALYSEDPGSSSRGGELGFYRRGELYPEFEAVAFNLEKGQVSDILKTQAGYHIIQMIERRGETINVRHILIKPKPSPIELEQAKKSLDSLATLIRQKKITFDEALKHCDDPGKTHGGMLVNSYTGNTRFEAEQLDPQVFFVVDKLQVSEISSAVPFSDEEGNSAYRILLLSDRTTPHRANLREDYNRVQNWALEEKQKKSMKRWVEEKTRKTYISIVDRYDPCEFDNKWVY
ncbi:MAG: peptidylprolyl isomerase [Bacteroidales bacterium]|nr:peptidylprolyl isomerase [Bacteroidales bacterium]MDZ4203981.1 peptidylprolyl isomerase [Bacteroidales bacterium]